MKVQILNNSGEVVWSYDIAAPVDQSGDSWTNGKHQIMAGVVFSLRRALEQAEVFPSDPEWKWPFSISQKSLAEWIEDWADYLVGFDANGDAIQATKAAAAVRKITIEANQTADFEDNDFSGKRSLMESVEAKTKDIMPVAFEFKCVPFEGLKERPFKLRLSIITGDRPVLVLRIIQLEAVQEEMANEFRDLLVEKFKDSKVETFIGTFTA